MKPLETGDESKPNILVEEINIDELDALIFIGGGGASQYFDDSLAHKCPETLEKTKFSEPYVLRR